MVRNGVMARLGLPAGTIRNVIMHRDIVPRAFACDYSLVSDLLGRVSDSFRNLECLHGSRRKVSPAACRSCLNAQQARAAACDAQLRSRAEHH